MGVWKFVMKCRPEWSKQEVARYCVERAGLHWDESGRKTRRPARDFLKERAEAEERAALRRKKELYVDPGREVPVWDADLNARWDAGVEVDLGERPEKLAASRGWPVEWVEGLLAADLISWPADISGRNRRVALKVEYPENHYERMRPVGYHQQYVMPDRKDWIFIPYAPKPGKGRDSELVASLRRIAWAQQWPEGTPGMTPPLPFVMGHPLDARCWIITEGQWDAITVWGALGGFEDSFEMPVAVFGLRGAGGGPVSFLAYWQGLIRRTRPRIWLMPDNDPASGTWDGWQLTRKPGHPRPIVFTDRLRALLGEGAVIPVSRVPASIGKDFNDLWRSDRRPSREALLREMGKMNIL